MNVLGFVPQETKLRICRYLYSNRENKYLHFCFYGQNIRCNNKSCNTGLTTRGMELFFFFLRGITFHLVKPQFKLNVLYHQN